MQTDPLSPEQARQALAYLTEVSQEGFVSRNFHNRRYEPRLTLTKALGHESRFITLPIIKELGDKLDISLAQLCASGLLMVRIKTEGKDPLDVPEQQALVASENAALKSLQLGVPIQGKDGKPLSQDLYVGDVLAPIVGITDGPFVSERAQWELEGYETNDGLFFNGARLKELAAMPHLNQSPPSAGRAT